MSEKTLKVHAIVKFKRLTDLLVNAFEGGSNYWYMITGYELRNGLTIEDFREGGSVQPRDDYYHWSQLIPSTKGCALFVGTKEDDFKFPICLNRRSMRAGAQIMAEKYPRHWANLIEENDDAETGDVFLQCCLFGELIYG
jgi:hypothetical protein